MRIKKIMKNKKALSDVIATVFLILIGITAIAILFVSIKYMFLEPALSPEISCFDLQLENPVSIKKACYNQESEDLEITLTRSIKDTFNLQTIDFAIDLGIESLTWNCGKDCSNCEMIKQGETKKYYINLKPEQTKKSITLSIQECILKSKEVVEC